MGISYAETTHKYDKPVQHDDLKTFFSILASGDHTRYQLAASLVPTKNLDIRSRTTAKFEPEALRIPTAFPKLHSQPDTTAARPKAEGIFVRGGSPVEEAKRTSTLKSLLAELHGMDSFWQKVKTVVKESQKHFRPLAEMESLPRHERKESLEAAGQGDMQPDALRLQRAVKRRCVGRERRTGRDGGSVEWVFEKFDAVTEVPSAAAPQASPPASPPLSQSTPSNAFPSQSPPDAESSDFGVVKGRMRSDSSESRKRRWEGEGF